ncbi:MAG: hypothetical protein KAI79_05610 [Bacteroidales bacterium]|nr:hypothetical protein [Bacteroidales bacterium]
MGTELSNEIIDMELYMAEKELEDMDANTDYSKVSDMTKRLSEETENLVRDQKIPAKDIIGQVSVTDMVIDLAMASLAKQTSVKLQKLETFLGKIEDKLFSDKTIKGMSAPELAGLYANTRLMRTDAFKMLKDIKKDVDFTSLEANLLSLHAKKSLDDDTDENHQMRSILESILMDNDFLEQAVEMQVEDLNKSKK